MLRVGLTGGIAAGKSTVAACFRKLGVPVLDADSIAREVCEPGEPGLAALTHALGDSILDPSGHLDRAALRHKIFADAALRRKVEDLLHPLILRRMRSASSALDAPYCILEIPLLAESGPARELVDRVLVVDAQAEQQIARLRARDGGTETEARAVLAAQTGRDERLRIADDVLANDADTDALEAAIRMLDGKFRRLAQSMTGKQAKRHLPPGTPT